MTIIGFHFCYYHFIMAPCHNKLAVQSGSAALFDAGRLFFSVDACAFLAVYTAGRSVTFSVCSDTPHPPATPNN